MTPSRQAPLSMSDEVVFLRFRVLSLTNRVKFRLAELRRARFLRVPGRTFWTTENPDPMYSVAPRLKPPGCELQEDAP